MKRKSYPNLTLVVMCRQAMARAEPAMVDIHGAVWKSPEEYDLVPNAKRYEVYEMSFAAKVSLCTSHLQHICIGHFSREAAIYRIWAATKRSARAI